MLVTFTALKRTLAQSSHFQNIHSSTHMWKLDIKNSVYIYIKTYGSLKQDLYKFDICLVLIFMVLCIRNIRTFWVTSNRGNFHYSALNCTIIGPDCIINNFLKVPAVLCEEMWVSYGKLNCLENFFLRSYVLFTSASRLTFHLIPINHEPLDCRYDAFSMGH
jgi:hypothetical protein